MPFPIESWLAEQPVIVLDGALATELERRGADLLDPLWSAKYLLEEPALIRAVHLDYFRAGADVATTATYQASFGAFERRGIGAAAAAGLMRDAVDLAVSARDEFWSAHGNRGGRRPLIAASVGPYGAMLADGSEYRGRYACDDRTLREFHEARLNVLATSGADVLAFETLPCLREALILAQLLRGYPRLSAWVSFVCRDDRHNVEGERVADCAAALQPYEQIGALGVNCTPPHHVESLLREFARTTDKPLLAYPNSGERYEASAKRWHGDGEVVPGALAAAAQGWYAAGARLIGGCCRTTPEDIQALRQNLATHMRRDSMF